MGLKSGKTTYELTLGELKDMFAAELGTTADKITISPLMVERGDQRDSYQVFEGIEVVVRQTR